MLGCALGKQVASVLMAEKIIIAQVTKLFAKQVHCLSMLKKSGFTPTRVAHSRAKAKEDREKYALFLFTGTNYCLESSKFSARLGKQVTSMLKVQKPL